MAIPGRVNANAAAINGENLDLLMMSERTVMQEVLFYSLSLQDHVPVDHSLRSIDRLVTATRDGHRSIRN